MAEGAKLANPDLHVIVTGGDGDGYGIGVGHFIHAMRRNLDLTYIVMNNEIYGLTTGQASPTSEMGMKTKSTPLVGVIENPDGVATGVAEYHGNFKAGMKDGEGVKTWPNGDRYDGGRLGLGDAT